MEAISFRVSFWAVKNGSKERRRETRLPCPASAAAQSREATVLPSRRHCAHRGRDARPRQPGGWRMRPDGFCRDVCHSGTGNDHAKFRQSEPNLGRWLRYRPESRRLSARQGGRAALRTRVGLQFGQPCFCLHAAGFVSCGMPDAMLMPFPSRHCIRRGGQLGCIWLDDTELAVPPMTPPSGPLSPATSALAVSISLCALILGCSTSSSEFPACLRRIC